MDFRNESHGKWADETVKILNFPNVQDMIQELKGRGGKQMRSIDKNVFERTKFSMERIC